MVRKRHTNKEYKLIHIVFGLAIGFFMGGVLVCFGLNRQNVSLLSFEIASLHLTGNPVHDSSGINNSQAKDIIEKNTTLIKDPAQQNTVFNNNLIVAGNNKQYDSIITLTSYSNHTKHTTRDAKIKQIATERKDLYFLFDTIELFPIEPKPGPEDIQVVKDELIDIKIIHNPKPYKNSCHTKYPELDSIMGKHTSPNNNDSFLIEFWETPLNSKGYKKGNNRLILYGIPLPNFVSLKYYKTTLYLKYLNQYYPLEFTSEFKSLKPVSNLDLIEQLEHL